MNRSTISLCRSWSDLTAVISRFPPNLLAGQDGNEPELLEQLAPFPLVPLLGDQAIPDNRECDAAELDQPAGGGHARPLAGVNTGHGELRHHPVALAELAENRDPQTGEASPIAAHVRLERIPA